MTSIKTFGGLRALRRRLREILSREWEEVLPALDTLAPPKTMISPLRTFFMDSDELIRWRSISAFGYMVQKIALKDMEEARIIMRQLMWTLNDESGGIGWGSPEAMGESMALNEALCKEYGRILLSYIWEDGNYLEYDALRIGALWGIMRTTMSYPEIMKGYSAGKFLEPYLSDKDPMAAGLALLALRHLGADEPVTYLPITHKDKGGLTLRIYLEGHFKQITI